MVTYGWRLLAVASNAFVLLVALGVMTWHAVMCGLEALLSSWLSKLEAVSPPQVAPLINRAWGWDDGAATDQAKEDETRGGQ